MIVWKAHKARIRHMAFSPDGAELATTAGNSKFVWTRCAATGEPLAQLAGHTTHARAVAYSTDGRFLASTQNTNKANVWDRASGKIIGVLGTPGWCVESLTFRPDSSGIVVASQAPPSGKRAPSTARSGGARRTAGSTRGRCSPRCCFRRAADTSRGATTHWACTPPAGAENFA